MNLRILKESVEVLALLAILLGLYLVYVEIRQNGVIARAEINTVTLQSLMTQSRLKLFRTFSLNAQFRDSKLS